MTSKLCLEIIILFTFNLACKVLNEFLLRIKTCYHISSTCIFYFRIKMFLRTFCPRLLFQVLMDIVLETNDAVRGTYLQFTRNVALAQLQRPIGYRFAGVMATFSYYTSYTVPYMWRQLSATGAVDDGHIVCSVHVVTQIFVQNRTCDCIVSSQRKKLQR